MKRVEIRQVCYACVVYILTLSIIRGYDFRPEQQPLLDKEIQCSVRRERNHCLAVNLRCLITHSVYDTFQRYGCNAEVVAVPAFLLTVHVVEEYRAIAHIGVGVAGGFIGHLVWVNLRVYVATAVIVSAVAGIAVIYFVEVHSCRLHIAVAGINAVLYRTSVLQEEHRLHILGSLVYGREVVGKGGVCHRAFKRHVAIGIFAPYFLPPGYS